MFPGINPKKMQAVMKQMGIKQEEITASRVVIEKPEGKIIIENPSVVKIEMQGQESFQISGETREEPVLEESFEEDVKILMEKTGVSEEQAKKALKETEGDLAEAIIRLNQ